MSIANSVEKVLSDFSLSSGEMKGGEPFFLIRSDSIKEACLKLKNELRFVYLSDITAVDWLGERAGARFEVIYNIVQFDSEYNEEARVFLKAALDDPPVIASVTPVWKAADWLEREIFDMFGIRFGGHPDLRRILLPEDFDGFPLRKDFDVRNREPAKRSFEKALKEGNF
ncbi:MAG: NADH-quinone oxidoreductase subunit C [Candidatus Mycalebacterium zealandia]|nr:MAG: NADH-quinone oxidoreductase subunit C [Candidatus Mycalebacterium zealandia]